MVPYFYLFLTDILFPEGRPRMNTRLSAYEYRNSTYVFQFNFSAVLNANPVGERQKNSIMIFVIIGKKMIFEKKVDLCCQLLYRYVKSEI